MTPAQLAKIMDGREYGHDITDEESKMADEQGLVVVFGYSDDNMEFMGFIQDEVSCWDGGTAYLTSAGLLESECDCTDCPYFAKEQSKAAKIEALWCNEGYSWTYKTDIPHATFDIMEEGEKYCRGIVFSMSDVVTK